MERMSNHPSASQGGLPPFQLNPPFPHSVHPPPSWAGVNGGFLPLLPQNLPAHASSQMQGHTMLHQPMYNSLPFDSSLPCIPPNSIPQNYPTPNQDHVQFSFVPFPSGSQDASPPYSRKRSLFVPDHVEHMEVGGPVVNQPSVDFNLREAVVKAAMNGVKLEVSPSNPGNHSRRQIKQSPDTMLHLSPYGRVKKILDITPPARDSPSDKLLNPSVEAFIPKFESSSGSFDADGGQNIRTESVGNPLFPSPLQNVSAHNNITSAPTSQTSPTLSTFVPATMSQSGGSSVSSAAPKTLTACLTSTPISHPSPTSLDGPKPGTQSKGWSTWKLNTDTSKVSPCGGDSEKLGTEKMMDAVKKEEKNLADSFVEIQRPHMEMGENCAEKWDKAPLNVMKLMMEKSDAPLSFTSKVKDKRDKSVQTESSVHGEKKKVFDHTPSNRKVIDLQAEVCRLRAQLCLNELQRERFQLELNIFWWRSNFQPVIPCPASRTMSAVQDQLQHLMRQIRQIELQRDQCLRILKSGRELLEVPSFTITFQNGEVITPANAMGGSTLPFAAPCTASTSAPLISCSSPFPSVSCTSVGSSTSASSSVYGSSCKKKKLDVEETPSACTIDHSALLPSQPDRPGLLAGKEGNPVLMPAVSAAASVSKVVILTESRLESGTSSAPVVSMADAKQGTSAGHGCTQAVLSTESALVSSVKLAVSSSVQDSGVISSPGSLVTSAGPAVSSAMTSAEGSILCTESTTPGSNVAVLTNQGSLVQVSTTAVGNTAQTSLPMEGECISSLDPEVVNQIQDLSLKEKDNTSPAQPVLEKKLAGSSASCTNVSPDHHVETSSPHQNVSSKRASPVSSVSSLVSATNMKSLSLELTTLTVSPILSCLRSEDVPTSSEDLITKGKTSSPTSASSDQQSKNPFRKESASITGESVNDKQPVDTYIAGTSYLKETALEWEGGDHSESAADPKQISDHQEYIDDRAEKVSEKSLDVFVDAKDSLSEMTSGESKDSSSIFTSVSESSLDVLSEEKTLCDHPARGSKVLGSNSSQRSSDGYGSPTDSSAASKASVDSTGLSQQKEEKELSNIDVKRTYTCDHKTNLYRSGHKELENVIQALGAVSLNDKDDEIIKVVSDTQLETNQNNGSAFGAKEKTSVIEKVESVQAIRNQNDSAFGAEKEIVGNVQTTVVQSNDNALGSKEVGIMETKTNQINLDAFGAEREKAGYVQAKTYQNDNVFQNNDSAVGAGREKVGNAQSDMIETNDSFFGLEEREIGNVQTTTLQNNDSAFGSKEKVGGVQGKTIQNDHGAFGAEREKVGNVLVKTIETSGNAFGLKEKEFGNVQGEIVQNNNGAFGVEERTVLSEKVENVLSDKTDNSKSNSTAVFEKVRDVQDDKTCNNELNVGAEKQTSVKEIDMFAVESDTDDDQPTSPTRDTTPADLGQLETDDKKCEPGELSEESETCTDAEDEENTHVRLPALHSPCDMQTTASSPADLQVPCPPPTPPTATPPAAGSDRQDAVDILLPLSSPLLDTVAGNTDGSEKKSRSMEMTAEAGKDQAVAEDGGDHGDSTGLVTVGTGEKGDAGDSRDAAVAAVGIEKRGRVDERGGVSTQKATDPDVVMSSVTEKLKELFPEKAKDAEWLKKTSREQTQLILVQLNAVPPLPHSTNMDTFPSVEPPTVYSTISPSTVGAGICQRPSGTDQMRNKAQREEEGYVQEQRGGVAAPRNGSPPLHPYTVESPGDLRQKREVVLAQQKAAMQQQTRLLERSAAMQQTLWALNQQSIANPGDVALSQELQSRLKQYQVLLDEAEMLGQRVLDLEQQQRTIQVTLETLHPNVLFFPGQPAFSPCLPLINSSMSSVQQAEAPVALFQPPIPFILQTQTRSFSFQHPNALSLAPQPNISVSSMQQPNTPCIPFQPPSSSAMQVNSKTSSLQHPSALLPAPQLSLASAVPHSGPRDSSLQREKPSFLPLPPPLAKPSTRSFRTVFQSSQPVFSRFCKQLTSPVDHHSVSPSHLPVFQPITTRPPFGQSGASTSSSPSLRRSLTPSPPVPATVTPPPTLRIGKPDETSLTKFEVNSGVDKGGAGFDLKTTAGNGNKGGAGFDLKMTAGNGNKGGAGFDLKMTAGNGNKGGAGFDLKTTAGNGNKGGAGFDLKMTAGNGNKGGAGFKFEGAAGTPCPSSVFSHAFYLSPPTSSAATMTTSSQSKGEVVGKKFVGTSHTLKVSQPSAFKAVESHSVIVSGVQSSCNVSSHIVGHTPIPSFATTGTTTMSSSCRGSLESASPTTSKGHASDAGNIPKSLLSLALTSTTSSLSTFEEAAVPVSEGSLPPGGVLKSTPSSSPTPAAAAPSPEAFMPLLPLKPIKVSSNRYAALAMLGSKCNLPSLTKKKEAVLPKSLTESFLSSGHEKTGSDVHNRGKKKVASDLEDDTEIVSKKRNVEDSSRKTDTGLNDLEDSEEDTWQVSTSKKRGGKGSAKKNWERQRTAASPQAQKPTCVFRRKDKTSPNSSAQQGTAGFTPLHTPPSSLSPQESSSSSAEQPCSSKDKACITFDGMTTADTPCGGKLRAKSAMVPSLLSLDVKPPPGLKVGEARPGKGQQSVTSAPQLSQFSFSKKLAKTASMLGRPRPNIDTGFIDQLVRNNEAANVGEETDSVPRKGWWKVAKSDKYDADHLPEDKPSLEEDWQKTGKKEKASGVSVQGSAEGSAGDSNRASSAAAKDPATKMTAYKKLCLNISNEFPHLKQEDIVKVIDEVKRAYGGHFHGKLFSSIMKDIRTVVLCQHPDKLRSVKQSKPVFTEMNALKKEKTPPSGKKAESTWQQCSSASGMSFKVRQGLEEECSICLVEFSAEMSYILDCGHNFHKQCIDRWVKDQGERTCPICRTIVLMREEFPHLRDTASPVQHLDKDFPYLSPPSARQ